VCFVADGPGRTRVELKHRNLDGGSLGVSSWRGCHPACRQTYVMADQADLVEVLHTLHQVLNYKGT
jgi:hypothetical protein